MVRQHDRSTCYVSERGLNPSAGDPRTRTRAEMDPCTEHRTEYAKMRA